MIEGSIDYSSSKTIGLDPILGDILFEASELPIIRGGWLNRNNTMIVDEFSGNEDGLKPVNIFKNGTIDSKKRENK
jgi:hypothetical protein